LLRENGELEVVELFTVVVIDSSGHGSLGDGDSLSFVCTRDTIADHGVDTTGPGGDVPAVVERALGDEVRIACRSLLTGSSAVGRVEEVLIELAVLCSQETVVFTEVNLVSAGNVDKAIVVLALRILVDQATGHDTHLLTVENRDIGESTGLDIVASIFREENGDTGVTKEINQLVVARLLEGAIAAPIILCQYAVASNIIAGNLPFVVIEAEEVNLGGCRVGQLTTKVLPSVAEDVGNVSSRVANRNISVNVFGNVILHVAGDSADVGGCIISTLFVDDLVTGEESKKIGVRCECLNDAENMVQILTGISRPRCRAVDVGVGEAIVHIQEHVNTSSVEDGCTLVVVDLGNQVVNSDSVDTKALHNDRVSQASIAITQRITSGSHAA
jgi:hypothetical protein